ncbi:MAG: class B sortase [Lachnospiraceae bacterium]|nr:class B sortase [Lachnospiraceae bacterium]
MKKKNSRKGQWYKIAAIICALAFIVFVGLCFNNTDKKVGNVKAAEEFKKSVTDTDTTTAQTPGQAPAQTPAQAPHGEDVSVPYKSPVDFEGLQEINPDICGWLEIKGTDISYPVLQQPANDAYYLDHDYTGTYDTGGALFTEGSYNKKDFTDPVTVIYGHHLRSGEMFGNLQKYYADDFEKYSDIVIYAPEEEIRYKAFAAISFSNRHILYYYNGFEDESMIKEFLDDINHTRSIGSYVDKDVEIKTDDHLIVLSTCLQGDRTGRFLVIGKRVN